MDEYSKHGRRFMNINLHFNEGFINLGLERMLGSHNSNDCLELLIKKLNMFNVSLTNDVVCITTDGASVMEKLGYTSPSEYQLCFAHAIHLAVVDVIYKKKGKNNNQSTNDKDIEDDVFDDDDDYDEEEDQQNEISDQVPDLVPELHKVLVKVRKIVVTFKRSPLKMDSLKRYSKNEFGQELVLILDSKTRWNSMLTMIQRFIKVKKAVFKSLVDFSLENLMLSDDELTVIENLAKSLELIVLGSEMICRREATLLTADDTLKFMVKELDVQDCYLAKDLKNALIERICQRRKKDLVGLLKFLDNPQSSKSDMDDDLFSMPSKAVMINLAIEIAGRLFPIIENIAKEKDSDRKLNNSIIDINQLSESMAARLEKFVKKKDVFEVKCNKSIMRQEFNLFEATNKRSHNLDMLYNALLTIRPSSVEAERVFSSTGFFFTNYRTRLIDIHLDALVFLRSHFKVVNSYKK